MIQQPTDAITKVTTTNICGSDLHLQEPLAAFTGKGDVLGHVEVQLEPWAPARTADGSLVLLPSSSPLCTGSRTEDRERMEHRGNGAGRARTAAAAGVLVVEAVLAVLSLSVHYSFTAEYGDVTDLAAEGWGSRTSPGVVGTALGLAVVAVLLVRQRWARLVAVAIGVLMVAGMLVVTPAALRDKLVSSYSDTPRCTDDAETGVGPGVDAAVASQEAFESIEHVGHFSGGGSSGVVGCDRSFLLLEDVEVLQHYRSALPRGGWRVVEDRDRLLRAERGDLAFEVVVCGRGGVVWAGDADIVGGAGCRPEY